MPHPIGVPSEIVRKWQEIVDLLAEIMRVPSALIMRVDPPNIKVLVSSESEGNPYEPDEAAPLNTGLYCETVMKTRRPLLVADALRDQAWKSNPDIKLGMISYLGVPITWPDGEIFGTICVLDNKNNEYSKLYLKLLLQWRDVLQDNLRSLATAQREVGQRETKIRRLVDANIIGVFIWDFDGRIIEANDAFLHIVGYDREDLIAGRIRWTDLTPPQWLERDAMLVQELKTSGHLEPFEKEYFRKDGCRVPVLIGVAPFEEDGNEGIAFVVDLTERKRAEQALRRSEACLAEGQRLTHTGSWIYNPATERTLYWSEEQFRIYGLDPKKDVPDQEVLRRQLHPEDRDRVIARFAKAYRDKTEIAEDFRIVLTDGMVKHLHVVGHPVLDGTGQLVEFIGTAVDVTARKRAEEALRETQRELARANRVATMGQLTASIAHEVNQPITATVANAKAALRWLNCQPPDLEEVRQALARIVRDGNLAGQVIGRIRDLIKKAPVRKEYVQINKAIRDVIELTRGEAVKNDVTVQTELADGLPLIEGDRVQLQQVMLNLIINAVEAMSSVNEGARELLISTGKADSDGVLIAVQDSGPGLAPASLDHLFDAFYTTKPSGLGLGLSICRSIIEAHRGRLWASANVPRGAVFQFTLPGQPAIAP